MKKFSLSLVLLLLLLVVNGQRANAQKETRLNSTPKAFQTFYAKFRNAVVKGDKKTVASLIRFPFSFEYVEENEKGTLSKTRFIEKYDDFFSSERKIFEQKNPVFYSNAGIYDLNDDWDASIFRFEKSGTSYKLVAYLATP